ncbi:uncharacterized protein CLUP02_01748 [Colletotrichum lupini]|uniref:Uncharacterized protein n=1 Tax=Colletotrichum lupini TaxID=145971 RepID=A0A9Q8WA79_9PEZI|nr:uncharacterized protein CLUP02_01748 [Colletotrichum lupini]UQC75095.1 hypothetical protein CLUP02_01748 [Colletotrichum lupini]
MLESKFASKGVSHDSTTRKGRSLVDYLIEDSVLLFRSDELARKLAVILETYKTQYKS